MLKKIIISALVLGMSINVVLADNPEARITTKTREMVNTLALNELEYIQLKHINVKMLPILEKATTQEEITAAYIKYVEMVFPLLKKDSQRILFLEKYVKLQ